MGKTLKLISTFVMATALTSTSIIAPTHASTLSAEHGELWSIEEAKNFYYEVEAEKDQVCGADINCRRDYNYNFLFDNPKYAIAEIYSMTSFMITAVNPAENSIKAYFRDLDNMAMEIDGEEKHYPLNELYIIWLDSDYDRYGISYIDAFRGGFLASGMHPIYQATTESNGENWFPVESEFEIVAPDADITQNESSMIEFYARFSPSSVLGLNNYSTCFASNDYEPGMECRMMYRGDGSYVFIPFDTTKEDTTDCEQPQPMYFEEKIYQKLENGTVSGLPTIPLAPDTGKLSIEEEKGSFQGFALPTWWPVIVTIATCAIPVIWFMLPNRQNKRKIMKKSLDKKEQTR